MKKQKYAVKTLSIYACISSCFYLKFTFWYPLYFTSFQQQTLFKRNSQQANKNEISNSFSSTCSFAVIWNELHGFDWSSSDRNRSTNRFRMEKVGIEEGPFDGKVFTFSGSFRAIVVLKIGFDYFSFRNINWKNWWIKRERTITMRKLLIMMTTTSMGNLDFRKKTIFFRVLKLKNLNFKQINDWNRNFMDLSFLFSLKICPSQLENLYWIGPIWRWDLSDIPLATHCWSMDIDCRKCELLV